MSKCIFFAPSYNNDPTHPILSLSLPRAKPPFLRQTHYARAIPLNRQLSTDNPSLDLHLLRQRKGLRDRPKLFWLTLLQQRSEHLAQRGPDE